MITLHFGCPLFHVPKHLLDSFSFSFSTVFSFCSFLFSPFSSLRFSSFSRSLFLFFFSFPFFFLPFFFPLLFSSLSPLFCVKEISHMHSQCRLIYMHTPSGDDGNAGGQVSTPTPSDNLNYADPEKRKQMLICGCKPLLPAYQGSRFTKSSMVLIRERFKVELAKPRLPDPLYLRYNNFSYGDLSNAGAA